MNRVLKRNISYVLVAVFTLFAIAGGLTLGSGSGSVKAVGETIGYTTDGASSDGVALNYYNAIRYQASTNMTVNQMKIKISVAGTGHMKCAIYSDNAGNPGTFLKGTNELSNLGVGWQTFSLTSSQALTSGTYYWLVSWRDSNYSIASDSATGVNWYAPLTYTSSWPTNLPTKQGQADWRHSFYAIAAATATPTPAATATPTPAATATPTPALGIIGYGANGTQSDGVAGNYYNALRYQASSNMTVTKMCIKISTAGTGKMKCAIYSDNAGSIGSFLKGTNELSNLGVGWQTFSLTAGQALTSGTYYWLVSWRDGTYAVASDAATGVNYWGSCTYAANWPTNLPASGGQSNYRHSFYATTNATVTPAPTATNTPTPTVSATSTPTPTPTSGATPTPAGTAINITRATKYQTVEGFGCFGAKDVWWSSSDPNHFYDDAWLTKIIDDLGLSITRDEIYPNNPVTSTTSTDPQDANWNKQRPFEQAIKAKADALRVPLKFIRTVWSPPGEWKINCSMSWAGDTAATRGGAHNSTKNGGTLDPAQYTNYANWLKAAIQMYADAGISVYGLSLQNELYFVETYNSCVYTELWYNDLLKNVVPTVKATYPNVKIFGSENMLSLEAASENYLYFYHNSIKNDANALSKIDKWAVHGYTDGVSAINASQSADYWTRHRTTFQEPSGKDGWMTETSGFNENWADDGSSDAFDLAISIQCALYYGHASAWVWWQGSDMGGINDYCLMNGTTTGKKYAVSKQFYRFIRPGSKMVNLSVGDTDIIGSAFENTTLNNFVVVLINMGSSSKTVNLAGSSIPTTFTMYRTTSTDNCVTVGTVNYNNITLPAKSVITLVNGAYKE